MPWGCMWQTGGLNYHNDRLLPLLGKLHGKVSAVLASL